MSLHYTDNLLLCVSYLNSHLLHSSWVPTVQSSLCPHYPLAVYIFTLLPTVQSQHNSSPLDLITQQQIFTPATHYHHDSWLIIKTFTHTHRHTGSVIGHMWLVCMCVFMWSLPAPPLVKAVSTLMVRWREGKGGEWRWRRRRACRISVAPQAQLLPSLFCLISVATERSKGGRGRGGSGVVHHADMSVFNRSKTGCRKR